MALHATEMTHILHLADPAYSSWSMRAWLVATRAGLDVTVVWHEIYGDVPLARQIDLPPARQVPVLVTADGAVVRDSLAIAEEIADLAPRARLWPSDPMLRGLARGLAAEMHAGFGALRAACPMVLRTAFAPCPISDPVAADLDRLEAVWSDAMERSGGPWLAGDWSIADAFFAPVAARIAGYGLPVGPAAAAYVARHLADPGFRDWRALGLEIGAPLHESVYDTGRGLRDWPGDYPTPFR